MKVGLVAAIVALTVVSRPVSANEMIQSLGPVAAHEPMLMTVGDKHVIAYFLPGEGQCNLQTVIWSAEGDGAKSARIEVRLNPGQIASIDGSATESLTLQCGDNAETLAVIDQQ